MKICMVVPCYNEASRLDPHAFERYIRDQKHLHFLFVNDGSTDGTGRVIRELAGAVPGNAGYLEMKRNRGKASAVRHGMLEANRWRRFELIGYMDADLSASLTEIDRAVAHMRQHPAAQVLFGSRYPGITRITYRRPAARFGRMFISCLVFWITGIRLKDTQCGFKLIRREAVGILFSEPFRTKWVFDAELLFRLRQSVPGKEYKNMVTEHPLLEWRYRKGSKIPVWVKTFSLVHLLFVLLDPATRVHDKNGI